MSDVGAGKLKPFKKDAIGKAFPGKQLKADENTKSLTRMIKDSLDRRGITDQAVQQKEMQEIIRTVKGEARR